MLLINFFPHDEALVKYESQNILQIKKQNRKAKMQCHKNRTRKVLDWSWFKKYEMKCNIGKHPNFNFYHPF